MSFLNPNHPLYVAVDVDGTLTRSNLSFLFGNFLYKNGLISLSQAIRAIVLYALHLLGILSVESLHRAIFSSLFLGVKRGIYEEAADRFFAEPKSFLRKDVVAEVEKLGRNGARLVLLSSSPDFLVQRMARHLNIEEWHGTEYCTGADGCFSNIGQVITGKDKAKLALRDKNEGTAILSFGDSMLDVPLFEVSNSVVVVCPKGKLAKMASKKGWRVMASE